MNNKTKSLLKLMINTPGISFVAPKLVKRISQNLAFQIALIRAYITCARHYYPKWASYFLDEEFQTQGAAFLLTCYHQNGVCPEPAELANIWVNQMMWLSEKTKQKHFTELIPVASRFLSCLETELRDRPEFQSVSKWPAGASLQVA